MVYINNVLKRTTTTSIVFVVAFFVLFALGATAHGQTDLG